MPIAPSTEAVGGLALPLVRPPRDVIDDRAPVTSSIFDEGDIVDQHPVDSDESITWSIFDDQDREDRNPVP